MKRTIRVSRDYENVKNIGVEIGIVTGLSNAKHSQEFQVFPVKDSIAEMGLIGVKEQTFAISFTPNF